MSIYKDHPHRVKIIQTDKQSYVVKSTKNKAVHRQEYELQDYLTRRFESVPKVWDYTDSAFKESFFTGTTYNQAKRNERISIIPKIAKAIKDIHDLETSDEVLRIFKRKPTDFNNRYKPFDVLKLLIGKYEPIINEHFNFESITGVITESLEDLRKLDYSLAIIHGDLSGNNIILHTGEIKFIDWTDARIDIPICDVVQFFHLTNSTNEEEDLFLDHYDSLLAKPSIIKQQRLFFLLYDFIDNYKKTGEIDKQIKSRIKNLIQ